MFDARYEFQRRCNRLMYRHQALARGYTASLRPDGLIVLQPRRFQFQLPVRGFVLLIGFFSLFKGFMLASLGTTTYAERLSALENGTLLEMAGSFVMRIDPLSQAIAELLAHFV